MIRRRASLSSCYAHVVVSDRNPTDAAAPYTHVLIRFRENITLQRTHVSRHNTHKTLVWCVRVCVVCVQCTVKVTLVLVGVGKEKKPTKCLKRINIKRRDYYLSAVVVVVKVTSSAVRFPPPPPAPPPRRRRSANKRHAKNPRISRTRALARILPYGRSRETLTTTGSN